MQLAVKDIRQVTDMRSKASPSPKLPPRRRARHACWHVSLELPADSEGPALTGRGLRG